MQCYGDRYIWINLLVMLFEIEEMDVVFDLFYQCVFYFVYGDVKIFVYDMICFSINIMCGCYGGCIFCFIIEYEGCII